MLTTFDIPSKGSIEELYRVKQQLYDFLNTLVSNKIPENDFMRTELRETVKELIKKQRTDLKHPRSMSWCLPEDDRNMPIRCKGGFHVRAHLHCCGHFDLCQSTLPGGG